MPAHNLGLLLTTDRDLPVGTPIQPQPCLLTSPSSNSRNIHLPTGSKDREQKKSQLQPTMDSSSDSRVQVIKAPSPQTARHDRSVFLAGTTSGPHDWRDAVCEQLSGLPITIYNPLRPDWDSSWTEDISCEPYRKQVEWELEKQELAQVIAFYFGAGTDAPISLLELGLCAKQRKSIVYVQEGYRKKGNVQIVCQRYGIKLVDRAEDLSGEIARLLDL
jgi:hypothetical protein